jgi:small subunit ribosomal protein S21
LKLTGRSVIVADGNVEKAMRKFKKKIQNSGLLQELRNRETFTKPTTRRKIKAGQARSRWRRYVESQKLPPRQY